MYKRTRNEFIVAYFLARCGKKGRGKQPPELEVDSWNEAYQLFWPNLNGGRPRKQFSNSLKNNTPIYINNFVRTNMCLIHCSITVPKMECTRTTQSKLLQI